MATTLSGRTIPCAPREGQMNTRDPDGDGVFDANDPGEVYANNAAIQVDEDAGTVSIPLVRSGGSGLVEVDYATSDGTAEAGTHYTNTSGTLQWSDGETGIKNVTVPVVDFPESEQGDRTFDFTISNPLNATIREDEGGTALDTTTVTIRDLNGATAEIPTVLWDGAFTSGSVGEWRHIGGHTVPEYGNKPPTGDGSLFDVTQEQARGHSSYSGRFVMKNSANGSEPADCDNQGENCTQRRTICKSVEHPGVLFWGQEYWISVSYYIPSAGHWTGGSSWGPVMFGVKPSQQPGAGTHNIHLDGPNGSWYLRHRGNDGPNAPDLDWQKGQHYTSTHPSQDFSPILLEDFPDIEASRAALASVNLDGWTDWVINVKYDHRVPGDGFLNFYKREDNGPWVHVLNILPKTITRSGLTFDRGIGFDCDEYWFSNIGLYANKSVVWPAPNNWQVHVANHRVYAAGTTLDAIAAYLTGDIGP